MQRAAGSSSLTSTCELGRSRHRIRWSDNIPVLSWLLLGGRCRFCHAPIAMRYLLVEALTAFLFVAVTARQIAQDPLSPAAWAAMALLVAALDPVLLGGDDGRAFGGGGRFGVLRVGRGPGPFLSVTAD